MTDFKSFIFYGREFKSINVCNTCGKTGPTTINKMYCIECLKANKKDYKRKRLDKLKSDPKVYKEYCDNTNAQGRKDYQAALKDPERNKKMKARKKRNLATEYKNRRNNPEAWARRLENDRINYKKRMEELKKDPEAYKEYRKSESKKCRNNSRKAKLRKNKLTLTKLNQIIKEDPKNG